MSLAELSSSLGFHFHILLLSSRGGASCTAHLTFRHKNVLSKRDPSLNILLSLPLTFSLVLARTWQFLFVTRPVLKMKRSTFDLSVKFSLSKCYVLGPASSFGGSIENGVYRFRFLAVRASIREIGATGISGTNTPLNHRPCSVIICLLIDIVIANRVTCYTRMFRSTVGCIVRSAFNVFITE